MIVLLPHILSNLTSTYPPPAICYTVAALSVKNPRFFLVLRQINCCSSKVPDGNRMALGKSISRDIILCGYFVLLVPVFLCLGSESNWLACSVVQEYLLIYIYSAFPLH